MVQRALVQKKPGLYPMVIAVFPRALPCQFHQWSHQYQDNPVIVSACCALKLLVAPARFAPCWGDCSPAYSLDILPVKN
jgi:hypothetical protein